MKRMYCNKCGESLPPGSRFCNVCGSTVVAGSDHAVERDPGSRDAEIDKPAWRAPADQGQAPVAAGRGVAEVQEIFTLKPTLIFVWMWYFLAAVLWIAMAALLGVISDSLKAFSSISGLIVVLIVGVVLFAIPVYKHILRSREVYTLTSHDLQMRFGLIAKTVRNIPVAKIQDVTVTSAVWQRLLNLGDIEIDSASEGGKIVLDNIHYPDRYASMILTQARRRN